MGIDFALPKNDQTTRRLVLTFTGRPCGKMPHCLRLAGTLTGTLTARAQQIPDIGTTYAISASGKLGRLGTVAATGTVQGTGFIRSGNEGLQLTLTARRGTLKISGSSALVPGFTSP
jgi:hypothetical protein